MNEQLELLSYENDEEYYGAFMDAIIEHALKYNGLTCDELDYIFEVDPYLYEEVLDFLASNMLFIYDSPNGEIVE